MVDAAFVESCWEHMERAREENADVGGGFEKIPSIWLGVIPAMKWASRSCFSPSASRPDSI